MRKTMLWKLILFVGPLLILQGAKCPGIPEMEDVSVTAVAEEYVDLEFEARGSINAESDVVTIDIDDLREELEDNDIDVGTIDTVVVHSILYGVTAYNEAETDRSIVNGRLELTRLDTDESAVLFDDVDVAVHPLLGELVAPPLAPGGVGFLNELMGDVLEALHTGTPSEFAVTGAVSGQSEPTERETNFDWRVRIYYQVAGEVEVERPSF